MYHLLLHSVTAFFPQYAKGFRMILGISSCYFSMQHNYFVSVALSLYLSLFVLQRTSLLSLIALTMEAARTSETLVNFYQTTRCYNPEDSNLLTSLLLWKCW
jgi:hypothetical protein